MSEHIDEQTHESAERPPCKRPTREQQPRRSVDFALWRKLWQYARPYRRATLLLCVGGVVHAAFEIAFPLITRRLVDEVGLGMSAAALWPYAWAYLGCALGISLSAWVFIRGGAQLRSNLSHDIRAAGFANLQQLPFSFYDQRPVGWLVSRLTSDCDRLSQILTWGLLDLMWGCTLLPGIALAMLVLHTKLALWVLAVLPLLILVSALFQHRILRSARAVRRTNSQLTAAYTEGLAGVETSKTFVRQWHDLHAFHELTGGMRSVSLSNALTSALYLPIVLALGSLATGLALAMGGIEVNAYGLSLGTLLAFLVYSRQFFDPINELARNFAAMQMAQAAGERVIGLIEEQADIGDHAGVRERLARAAGQARAPHLAMDGLQDHIERIVFRGVSFAYTEKSTVLSAFDLEVQAGQTIALVGSTGGGKSTIVNLLCRFYEPTAGEILLDGIDYRERPLGWLQAKLGIVLQTPHLFSGTIAENIRYGRLEATDAELEEAARLVGANEFIEHLEEGYRSQVGEGGARLSTGQKQLISFARALLADPQILVMDEATSSIDPETESRLQRGLETILEGRTSFVIAHRLSTVAHADRILVIEQGRIVESGSHLELLGKRGRYHELYTRQSLCESGRGADDWDATGEGVALA